LERFRIIVGGFLGLLPAGGVTWDYVQYPLGLAALGHDVYYVEDTGLWPIYQADSGERLDSEPACRRNVDHLGSLMELFGLGDRWAYRDEVTGRCFGMIEKEVAEACRTADLFINVSCSTPLRAEYAAHHFTFGENFGATDCRMPSCGVTWHPTRQPICLDRWVASPVPTHPGSSFTTVMNWSAGKSLAYDGEIWGQKDSRYARVEGLPGAVPDIPLAIAVGRNGRAPFPAEQARRCGWTVLDPDDCAGGWEAYRAYIRSSRGEFSVAKETYVKARTGWFSCRSACYLASGRPVVAEETGWSRHYPTGEGLFAFGDLESAAEALRRVTADPQRHARAARRIAEEFFDSDRVLSDLLVQVGV
jgi:hypothetical protein